MLITRLQPLFCTSTKCIRTLFHLGLLRLNGQGWKNIKFHGSTKFKEILLTLQVNCVVVLILVGSFKVMKNSEKCRVSQSMIYHIKQCS